MAEGGGLLNRYRVEALSRVRIPPAPPEAIENIYVFASLAHYAQSNVQLVFACAIGLVVLAVVEIFGAIVSISAKVNKLGSSIED